MSLIGKHFVQLVTKYNFFEHNPKIIWYDDIKVIFDVLIQRHDWDVKELKPFLQLRIGKLTYMRNTTERRKFVQFLADGLPNRTLYSVYHRFRNLYEKKVQRR